MIQLIVALVLKINPAGIKSFKVNIETPKQCVQSLFLYLNRFYTFFGVSIADFEQVNTDWK